MNPKKTIGPAAIIPVFLFLAALASAEAEEFVGQWTNTDTNSGIARLVISEDKGSCMIQAWGRRGSGESALGKAELKLLTDSEKDKTPRYGFAHFYPLDSDVYVTLRFDNARRPEIGTLMVETFVCFAEKYKARRSNQHSLYFFRKE